MDIFIVTYGEYSDYSVNSVHTSLEAAQKAVEAEYKHDHHWVWNEYSYGSRTGEYTCDWTEEAEPVFGTQKWTRHCNFRIEVWQAT